MRFACLVATAMLAGAVSLSGCSRSDPASLAARFPTAAKRILSGPGFARDGDRFTLVEPAGTDPVKAAEASLHRRGGLRVQLPAHPAGPANLSLPGGFAIEVRERGLLGPGRAVDGALAYPRAGGTSWWTATEAGFEEWLQVEDAGDLPVAEWEVSGATLRQAGDGAELLDAAGNVRIRVTAPAAFEAGGAARRAWLRVDGVTLALFTDARGAALVDPAWVAVGSLPTARRWHTATLLHSGKVLVAGGNDGSALASAGLYDPATGAWTDTGALSAARFLHTATLLPSGKVLVMGGYNGSYLASAELYDPAAGTWSATGSMLAGRYNHTATLLPSGQVLVAAGYNAAGGRLASAELYDPSTATWTSTGALAAVRERHTATLLQDGSVLVAGGNDGGWVAGAEVYDPVARTWSATGPLLTGRYYHTATLLPSGKVLVAGGAGASGSLSSAELYDPVARSWSATGTLATARSSHTATLLPSGRVLVAGGSTASVELYDPQSATWSSTGSLAALRYTHTATLLPSGKVAVAGGGSAIVEQFDPASGSWSASGSLTAARRFHSATLLPSGKVLVAGGVGASHLASAELYDPATGSWSPTGSLAGARGSHEAALLRTGKVLVVGGESAVGVRIGTAELYDPESGTWSSTGSLSAPRFLHTLTVLASGKVLVAGGFAGGALASAELYDPAAGTWSLTGPLNAARYYHTATLLESGEVLVAGGDYLSTAELYDPATGSWSVTGSMADGRTDHTATRLLSGKVLVAAGAGRSSAELYDPATGSWSTAGSLSRPRSAHTATLLPSGSVLVAGGYDTTVLAEAELYDPDTGAWSLGAPLPSARTLPSATLLPSGKVLVAGGFSGSSIAIADLYDEGRGAQGAWAPAITAAPAAAAPGSSIELTGTLFTGLSEGSGGGVQSSPANYPLVLLQRAGEPEAFAPVTDFSATSATVTLPSSLRSGWSWLSVVVNGIRSEAIPLDVNGPPTAQAQSLSTWEDTPLLIALAATDPEGDAPTYSTVTPPAHGHLSGSGASLTYTPNADYAGPDGFTFTASDGLATSTPATVSVTVQAVNDAPGFVSSPPPTATEDVLYSWAVQTADVDGPIAVTTLVADSCGATFAAGTYSFTPPGPVPITSCSFTVQVCDAGSPNQCTTRATTVTVVAVNDPPAVDPIPDQTAQEDAGGRVIAIRTSDETPSSGLTVTATSSNPAVIPSANLDVLWAATGGYHQLTMTPAADANGTSTITVTVGDGLATATRTFTLTVTAVNDPPDAVPDAFTVDEDSSATTLDVLANDVDVDGGALTIFSVTQPPNGTVTFTAGAVRYTPAPDWSGVASFTYAVSDGQGGTDAATVSVTVAPVNDPPVAVDDGPASTFEDTPLDVSVLSNDYDVDAGDSLSVVSVTQPPHGLVTFTATSVRYTPAPDWSGSDSFTCTVSDGLGATDTATVSVTVTPVNDSPYHTVPGPVTLPEDGWVTFAGATAITVADLDAGGSQELMSLTATNGRLTLSGVAGLTFSSGDGTDDATMTFQGTLAALNAAMAGMEFHPDPDFAGGASVQVWTSDMGATGSGGTKVDADTVTLTVTPVNDTPLLSAAPPTAAIEDVAYAYLVEAVDVDGPSATFALAPTDTCPGATIAGGLYSFTPAGPVPVSSCVVAVQVCDGGTPDLCATQATTVWVTAVNDPLSAVPDAFAVDEDSTATTLDVLANDVDVDGDALSVTSVTQPPNGTVTFTAGAVRYTPAPNWNGSDSFTYTASDGQGATDTATVSVTVAPVNDPPDAVPDAFTVGEDAPATTLDVLANDVDGDGDALTVTGVTQPPHGTVTFTADSVRYTPAPDWSGDDVFTYVVSDGQGGADTATVSVTVNPVNDAPVAQPQAVSTGEDASVQISLGATDLDGDSLTYTVLTPPTHGTLTGTGATLVYAPAADYHGPDAFTFVANDGALDSAPASVGVTVTPQNDAPIAQAGSVTTDEDQAVGLTLAASDLDDGVLSFEILAPPAHGTLAGSGAARTFTPDADFHGTDSFTFRASDGSAASNVATVSITVTTVNDLPVAVAQAVAGTEDLAAVVTLGGSDVDGDSLTFRVVTLPAHGALTGSGSSLTYTPDADYHGADTFAFVASDGQGDSAPAVVSLDLVAVNDLPTATAQTLATDEDAALPVTLSGADADGDALAFSVVTPPSHGALVVTGGVLTYTPAADYNGEDSFTFEANDGTVDSAAATVSVTVAAVNDAPVATDQAVTLDEDGSVAVTLAGTDVEGDALDYTVVTPPAHGTLTGTGASLTYTPARDYDGPDAFTFSANDGTVDSAPATVSITVTAVAEPSPEGGCSCGTSGDVAPLGALLLGLLGLRRRRRPI